MKVIDCFWEKKNLNKSVAEVVVENNDVFDVSVLKNLETTYNYIVVKVPMKKPDFNMGLSELRYSMVETQCKLSKKFKDFDFEDKLVRHIYQDVSFDKIHEKQSFDHLISCITPNMFSTDRITLDPYFGPEIGCMRYKNWMSSAFCDNQANFLSIRYKGEIVGFSMYKEENGIIDGILGGIFEKYQSVGLGILTPTRHFLCAKQNNHTFKKLTTSISSNNVPVWQFYNYLNFKIDQLYYVFVKHI